MAKILPEIPAAVMGLYSGLVAAGVSLYGSDVFHKLEKDCDPNEGMSYMLKQTSFQNQHGMLVRFSIEYCPEFALKVLEGDEGAWKPGHPEYWIDMRIDLKDREQAWFTLTYENNTFNWEGNEDPITPLGKGQLVDLLALIPEPSDTVVQLLKKFKEELRLVAVCHQM